MMGYTWRWSIGGIRKPGKKTGRGIGIMGRKRRVGMKEND